jgi:pimeloyl-ACP methyl ester carboxylesterase
VTGERFVAETTAGAIVGWSNGSGDPILVLHGGPAMSDYMDMIAGELAGWRWVTYQQRSLAPSSADGPFSVQQHVSDAVAVLDALGIERAVVAGHSWGGFLALALAIGHPDRVSGLVVIDGLGAVGDGGVAEMGKHLRERLLPDAVEPYAAVTARLESPEASDDDMLESLRLLWPGYFGDPPSAPPLPAGMRASLGGYIGTFTSVAEQMAAGFTARLGEITVPAVFVLGERSPMPVSAGQQTADALPSAEVIVVPGAGHLPWHEQPGCVAAALARLTA